MKFFGEKATGYKEYHGNEKVDEFPRKELG